MQPKSKSGVTIVRLSAKDKRLVKAMAFSRSDFKDRCESHLTGALREFYKARLGAKNSLLTWVDHWDREVDSLLNRALVTAILHSVKGFSDKRKAFDEACRIVASKDANLRRITDFEVCRDFNLTKPRKPIDDSDTKAFWGMVEESVGHLF